MKLFSLFNHTFRTLEIQIDFYGRQIEQENVKSIDPIVCETHQTEKIEVRLTEILLLQYKKWICAVKNDSLCLLFIHLFMHFIGSFILQLK